MRLLRSFEIQWPVSEQSINSEVSSGAVRPAEALAAVRQRAALDDQRLVERLVDGSEQAWAEFVAGYAGLVRSRVGKIAVSCGLGADSALVDDLVAEVFSALLNKNSAALRAYRGRSSLATYLCVIATRVAIRKSLRTNPSQSDSSNVEPVDLRAPTPTQAVICAEQREQLHQLIQALPNKQQAMVQLFYLEGMSYEQISARLGVPIGSIGPTLKRAEEKLKSQIEAY